jgi:hypothetical protein
MSDAEQDDLRARLHLEFTLIADRYKCPGWVEFQLWKVVEGMRKEPIVFLSAVSEEEMEILQLLRDVVQEWVLWNGRGWVFVDLERWRGMFSQHLMEVGQC